MKRDNICQVPSIVRGPAGCLVSGGGCSEWPREIVLSCRLPICPQEWAALVEWLASPVVDSAAIEWTTPLFPFLLPTLWLGKLRPPWSSAYTRCLLADPMRVASETALEIQEHAGCISWWAREISSNELISIAMYLGSPDYYDGDVNKNTLFTE